MTPSPHLKRLRWKRRITLRLLLSHCIKLSGNILPPKNMIITTMKLGESDMMDNILLVLLTAGELHPGECALRDGGNEKKCGAHPDSCHAGNGNQSPQPVGGADPQTDRRWDPGEDAFERAWDNLFAANPNEQLWGSHPSKNTWCHLRKPLGECS